MLCCTAGVRWGLLAAALLSVCELTRVNSAYADRRARPRTGYQAAQKLLAEEHFAAAAEMCEHLATSGKAISPWANLCAARAYVLLNNVQRAGRLLHDLNSQSAASAYGRALEIYLRLEKNSAGASAEIEDLRQLMRLKGLDGLEPSLKILSAKLVTKQNRRGEALVSLQRLRGEHPKGFSALLARQLQRVLVPTVLSPVPEQKDLELTRGGYWAKEVELLTAEGRAAEGLKLSAQLQSHAAIIFRTLAEQQAFASARWGALKNLKKRDQIEREQQAILLNEHHPLFSFTLNMRARNLWARYEYDGALNLARRLPPQNADRQFLEARIDEANGDIASARAQFQRILLDKRSPYRQQVGMRLLGLLAMEEAWSELIKVGDQLSTVSAEASAADLLAVRYWTTVAKEHLSTDNSALSYTPEYGSYYFWLRLGLSVDHPHASDLTRRVRLARCNPSPVKLDEALADRVSALADDGLFELAADEVRFALPEALKPQIAVARARVLSERVAVTEAWKELTRTQSLPALLAGPCGREAAEIMYPTPYLSTFRLASAQTGIDTELLLAIARTESAFNPRALSPVGARGLMQLMPGTAVKEGFPRRAPLAQLFDPSTSIFLGAKHLKRVIDLYDGKWWLAFAAYNAGAGAVDKWLKRYSTIAAEPFIELVPYLETRNYIKRNITAYQMYRILLNE